MQSILTENIDAMDSFFKTDQLGISCTDLAKQLEMSQPGVGYAVNRGEKIAKEHNYQLL
jgi:hypothetical protein